MKVQHIHYIYTIRRNKTEIALKMTKILTKILEINKKTMQKWSYKE